MEFAYRKEQSNIFGTIYRPVVNILIQSSNKEWISQNMYIDSGADITLIPKSMGDLLGFKFRSKDIKEISGIGEGVIPILIEKVKMRIGDIEFDTRIAWALIEEVPFLLGRIDVFDYFKICFQQNKKLISFDKE